MAVLVWPGVWEKARSVAYAHVVSQTCPVQDKSHCCPLLSRGLACSKCICCSLPMCPIPNFVYGTLPFSDTGQKMFPTCGLKEPQTTSRSSSVVCVLLLCNGMQKASSRSLPGALEGQPSALECKGKITFYTAALRTEAQIRMLAVDVSWGILYWSLQAFKQKLEFCARIQRKTIFQTSLL